MLFLVKVEGESAWPELIPEKYYFATSLLKPRVGDFIVFQNPKNSEQNFVKKIKSVNSLGCEVYGLTSWSSSSKNFGLIKNDLVFGKIL